jgi:glycosyltransferase involved in cell wall biosynthesis
MNEAVSIVVPIYKGIDHLDILLDAIKRQTTLPEEVIFVLSESDESESIQSVLAEQIDINVKCKLVDLSYPGKARNIGVDIASSSWVAFLDLRSIPSRNWLESLKNKVDDEAIGIVGAMRTCSADTFYKRILKAATLGNDSEKSVAGSLVNTHFFRDGNYFLENIRAGEDLEWLDRMSGNTKIVWLEQSIVDYQGLSTNIFRTIEKYVMYAFENSKIDILKAQKYTYFLVGTILVAMFLYSWNYTFTQGQWDQSPYFIPHLNKIAWSGLFVMYMLYRGFYRPLLRNERLRFLRSGSWLLIGALGICIDLAKAPGRLIGFFKSFSKTSK